MPSNDEKPIGDSPEADKCSGSKFAADPNNHSWTVPGDGKRMRTCRAEIVGD